MAGDKGQALKDKIIKKAMAACTATASELRTQLREQTPKRTGRTSRQWYATPPVLTGTGISFSIKHPFDGSSPDKSPRVEWLSEGTAAHDIFPVRGKVLVFPGSGAGGVVAPTRTGGALVFTPMVHHPGTKGTEFIDRVLSQQNVSAVFQQAFARTS